MRQEEDLPLVVCCRLEEYQEGKIFLDGLRGAICLQPLSDSQIETYFSHLNRQHIWNSLQTDLEGLLPLARIPLFLHMIPVVYTEGLVISSNNDTESELIQQHYRSALFEAYIERKLVDETHLDRYYDPKQVKLWLKWLAQKMSELRTTEFLIEKIQPAYLTKQEKWIYSIASWLCFWIIFSIITQIFTQLTLESTMQQQLDFIRSFRELMSEAEFNSTIKNLEAVYQLRIPLIENIISVLVMGLALGIVESFFIERKNRILRCFIVFITYTTIASGILIFSLRHLTVVTEELKVQIVSFGISYEIILGLIIAFFSRSKEIRPTQSIRISIRRFFKGLKFGLFIALTLEIILVVLPLIFFVLLLLFSLGNAKSEDVLFAVFYFLFLFVVSSIGILIFGIIIGTFVGVTWGLISNDEIILSKYPNQGITTSAKNSIYLLFICFFLFLLLPDYASAIFLFCFLFSGMPVIQHCTLRLLLWHKGSMPLKYNAFLDYACDCKILKRTGGRYRFLHDLLREYIASSLSKEKIRVKMDTMQNL